MAATAVIGVIVIGGLPALALTLADAETGTDTETTSQTAAARRPGPPPWAHGQKAGKADKDEKADKHDEAREDDGRAGVPPGWARHGDQVPPGWARNHPGKTPHGRAMRAWAHCVADAASGLPNGEKLDPEAACGERPAPPGRSERSR